MSDATYYTATDSPIGRLLLTSDGESVTGLHMLDAGRGPAVDPRWTADATPLRPMIAELTAYFAGKLRDFTTPVRPAGTRFQQLVWKELRAIPYGATISYGELARRIGSPSASRAVGLANGRNPVAVVIPCHRVIGSNGTLTGYGGGLERKRWLLDLERGS